MKCLSQLSSRLSDKCKILSRLMSRLTALSRLMSQVTSLAPIAVFPPFRPYLAMHCAPLCPLLCNHLDFYLPSALPSTQLCPCPVPSPTPDLHPPVMSFNMSLVCHQCPLLPSFSWYPSHPPLSLSCPPLRLTYAFPSPCPSCPCPALYAALRPAR